MPSELIFNTELTLEQLLKHWEASRFITPLDRHFALQMSQMHQQKSPLFMLVCLLVSQQLSNQHTCLLLDHINLANPLNEQKPSVSIAGSTQELAEQLASFDAIQKLANLPPTDLALPLTSVTNKPLVLENKRLYLQRYHTYEVEVTRHLQRIAESSKHAITPNIGAIQQTLAMLFPTDLNSSQAIDWQKVATATAFSQQLSIITGGPGTGKTTTVTKLLYLLQSAHLLQTTDEADLVIKLVAPTGKAAARLSESIKASKLRLGSTLEQQSADYNPQALALIPEQASTLHRLLGVIPNSHRFRHHKGNPLRLDLLIVDEASMVDLPMMHRLLDALPEHAKLILLGDQDQLASVEAGAVLADICQGLKQQNLATNNEAQSNQNWRMRYSAENVQQLSQLTGLNLTEFADDNARLGNSLCMLTHSHRFRDDAGIGQLAKAVNRSDKQAIMQVWQQGYQELYWIEHAIDSQNKNQGLTDLLTESVGSYSQYLSQIKQTECNAETIINSYNQFRILCAMRSGEYGVEGLNFQLEQALKAAGLIKPSQEFYIGRPVIIQSNDYNLGLFNGDIGLILPDTERDNRPMAHFIQADASILKILPARLPSHETCFAMTVHKSQGSEFESVALVLPPKPSLAQKQLLTKELVYTGITRAKVKFICLGSVAVFEQASLTSTQRASGLADRLWH